ncbi:MAG TPA: 2-hydroxychromene-2-carboxylate isomerase [Candidatus Polarisedimenticolaceae bacterium]
MRTLEFWFDFGSTYSYPAAMRVEALAASRGVALAYRPFLLGPIFRLQGWSDSPFNLNPRRGAYMWRDVERICAGLGIPFRRPSSFPRNGLLAARVCCAHEGEPWIPAFVRAVFDANFARDREIAEPATIAACLEPLGLDPGRALAAAGAQPAKDLLRARTDEAERRGVFGAPTWFAGDELFWGNDRLEAALDWLERP